MLSYVQGAISSQASPSVAYILCVPVIDDDVYFSAGCKILGAISIGNCSIIGAVAVVLQDVPAYSVVVGDPARIIKK